MVKTVVPIVTTSMQWLVTHHHVSRIPWSAKGAEPKQSLLVKWIMRIEEGGEERGVPPSSEKGAEPKKFLLVKWIKRIEEGGKERGKEDTQGPNLRNPFL